MEQYKAREFANIEKPVLWTTENHRIEIVFDDGVTECWWREAVLSSYCWKLFRDYPSIPLDTKYLIRLPCNKNSINKMWEKIIEDTIKLREELDISEDTLSVTIAKEYNKLFNDIVRYGTEYITSASARELREIMDHPTAQEIYRELTKPSEAPWSTYHAKLKDAYSKMDTFIRTSKGLYKSGNGYARALRYGCIDPKQFSQVTVARGFTTDIDYHQFEQPVLSSYGRGIHNMLWTAQESRGASIANMQSKDPVQKSDYLNRRLQLMTAPIRTVFKGDCGTKETIPWMIRNKSELTDVVGVLYKKEDGTFGVIKKDDELLVGKELQIRAAPVCHRLHEYGVCEHCLGEIAKSIPKYFSIGHISVISALGAFVQLSLSAKHLIVSKESVVFVLDHVTTSYLKFPNKDDHNTLMLSPKVVSKQDTVEFIFHKDQLRFINDLANDISSDDIQITSATDINKFVVQTTAEKSGNIKQDVLNIADMGRNSNFSRDFLNYVFNNQDMLTVVKNSVHINLAKWNTKDPMFTIPLKITGVKDFMSAFESTITVGAERHNIDANSPIGISDMMRLCYDIVKQCVNIPVAHLGVMIATLLIRDSEKADYRHPLPNGPREFSKMKNIYLYRSASQMMAFERRMLYFKSGVPMLSGVKPNHPFDALFFPSSSDIYEDVREADRLGTIPKEVLPDYLNKQ